VALLRRFEALGLLPDTEEFNGYIERDKPRKWKWNINEVLEIIPQEGAVIQLCKHRTKRYGSLLKFTHPKGARIYLKVDAKKLKNLLKKMHLRQPF